MPAAQLPLHEAHVTLAFPTGTVAAAVARALAVELVDAPEGAVVQLSVNAAGVTARITAPDIAALRAALTGFVRLAEAAGRTAAVA